MRIFLDESLKNYHNTQMKKNKKPRIDQSILWGDKNLSKIEFQIHQYWRSKGLIIKFIGKSN
jgi:hypothetical protein